MKLSSHILQMRCPWLTPGSALNDGSTTSPLYKQDVGMFLKSPSSLNTYSAVSALISLLSARAGKLYDTNDIVYDGRSVWLWQSSVWKSLGRQLMSRFIRPPVVTDLIRSSSWCPVSSPWCRRQTDISQAKKIYKRLVWEESEAYGRDWDWLRLKKNKKIKESSSYTNQTGAALLNVNTSWHFMMLIGFIHPVYKLLTNQSVKRYPQTPDLHSPNKCTGDDLVPEASAWPCIQRSAGQNIMAAPGNHMLSLI